MPTWAAEMKRFGIVHRAFDEARPAVALVDELVDAGRSRADQGEFGGDEEAVDRNQGEHGDELEDAVHQWRPTGRSASSGATGEMPGQSPA